ncbi:uncharacterized protein LOC132204778 [Neocloeon triangulifer]|uniref:uncharacterized protein LOC132204778 n=1 Tax=Neocloeon triangulifer TaxID=2078957 RepID=UPI00286F65D9|nr:uncharacterized protein LOC132204778 [Neocloeon triangulifer]
MATLLVWTLTLLLVFPSAFGQQSLPECSQLLLNTENSHQSGVWRAKLNLPVKKSVTRWMATVKFSRPINEFINSLASSTANNNQTFVLRAFPSSKRLKADSVLNLQFEATYTGPPSTLSIESIIFDGSLVCNAKSDAAMVTQIKVSNSSLSTGRRRLKYEYATVMHNSILFYEAQRSGVLPSNNRISWRKNSCVNDKGNNNEDLSGGYYTTGRTLKFTFPTAAAMTILAWGIINHEEGYKRVGELNSAKDALKWGIAYLEKCHTKPEELYVLVGDVQKEGQDWWGRPEDINFPRPAYAVNTSNPGSEVAAETAAAFAASSIVFADDFATRSRLRNRAKQLYQFAKNYRGDYHEAVKQVINYYKSWSHYQDELVWAALWLYRATGQEIYLTEAKTMYASFKLTARKLGEFSWDEKTLGVRILLASLTAEQVYVNEAKSVCDELTKKSEYRNSQGFFHIRGQPVGGIRYAANVAFACFELGEVLIGELDLPSNPYLKFALQQVNLILGDTGRSFMVGFGHNYPKRILHYGGSCPNIPQECGFKEKNAPGPNPQVVVGALVGGPDEIGNYNDSRDNYSQNDVGIDYNAGFQSLVAALISLHCHNKLPTEAYITNAN